MLAKTFIFLAFSLVAGVASAEPLYTWDGKTINSNDLAPAHKQSLFDIEMRRVKQVEALVDDMLLDQYFADQSKKQNKAKEEIQANEFKGTDPTEKEIKKFYEENKERIPPNYTYDQVKPEIKRVLMAQQGNSKREALLAKIKKANGFKFKLTEPTAPTVDIKTAGFPALGKDGAKVTIVEFADYLCPHCRESSKHFSELMKKYKDKVQLVFIDYPIKGSVSRVVAEGGYCAHKQGKYWEYNTTAFNDQAKLNEKSPAELAKKLGLDEAKFKQCIASAEAKTFVSKAKEEGDRVGVSGTPAIFINGKRYIEAHTVEDLKKAVEKHL